MQIKNNSRQIPKDAGITANKQYNDLMYSYLQTISQYDDETKERFIDKKQVQFSKLGEDLGVSRQTASNRFKRLLDLGLLIFEDKNSRYRLVNLDKTLATLVPLETLQVMVSALSENCISIYVYLFNRYFASGQKAFTFTYDQLKSFIGISTSTKSNSYIVKGILDVLERLGLIEIESYVGDDSKHYHLLKMITNELPSKR